MLANSDTTETIKVLQCKVDPGGGGGGVEWMSKLQMDQSHAKGCYEHISHLQLIVMVSAKIRSTQDEAVHTHSKGQVNSQH